MIARLFFLQLIKNEKLSFFVSVDLRGQDQRSEERNRSLEIFLTKTPSFSQILGTAMHTEL